jgi:hypothetical protein
VQDTLALAKLSDRTGQISTAHKNDHVQRLLRESENATLKLVSLIHSTRSFVCGTDGGLLNGLGTFGYVWRDPQLTSELLPFGMVHVPGASLIMSSTRTEMCGIFAALTHLRLIVVSFLTSFSARKPRAAFIATVGLILPWYYDFEVAIRTCLLRLPISIEWEWVRGHRGYRTSLFLKYLTTPLTILPH